MAGNLTPFKILFGFFAFLILFFGFSGQARATHIRAGEITAQSDTSANPNLLKYTFKLVTYVDPGQLIPDDFATLFFGDGTSQTSPKASDVNVAPGINRRTYFFSHIYAAGGRKYTVTYSELNRNAGIRNMQDPANTSFLLQTTIAIFPQIGINRTPQFTVPPLDNATIGQVFIHFPGGFDRDQDSVSYELRTPLRNVGLVSDPQPAPVIGYQSPQDFSGPTVADGITQPNQPGFFRLNPRTGEIRWNTPNTAGEFNIAFVMVEWKLVPGGSAIRLGEVMRDMQITVKPGTINLRPILTLPKDTCIIAGNMLQDTITAVDGDILPNPKDSVTITAFSGIIPPATFKQIKKQGEVYRGVFRWTPTCNDIAAKPYEVVFKATDVPEVPQPALVDLKTWNITVIGPAPTGLFAATLPNRQISLVWNNYTVTGCANAAKIKIYRRENPANFIPQYCETGVPAYTGYTEIAEVPGNATSYVDNNNGQGLKMGATFCYLIYAEFPLSKGGKSLASAEVCAEVPILGSAITNVSVLETSQTTGRIFTAWTQPIGDLTSLNAPYQYRLYRAGSVPGSTAPLVFKQIYTTPNITTDTTFTDTNRNTTDSVFTYKVEFYYTGINGQLQLLETPLTASSVRLDAVSSGETMNLNWAYNVPWDNRAKKHLIYRKINNVFTLIDSVQAGAMSGTYTDRGTFNNEPLKVGETYCYYIETVGTYAYSKLKLEVRNNSQEFCQIVRDTTSPCPPLLQLALLNCDSIQQVPFAPPFSNKLHWTTDPDPDCGKDIKEFNVYFRAEQTGAFTKIATLPDSSYLHANLLTPVGCYAVTAVDSSGNESAYSNVVCQDACYFFELPNIITPNNDGFNDTFRPRQAAFVRKIKFTVFNRWGQKIFENDTDPAINWGGVNENGDRVTDGVYFYRAEVEFLGQNPELNRQTFKGWVQIVR